MTVWSGNIENAKMASSKQVHPDNEASGQQGGTRTWEERNTLAAAPLPPPPTFEYRPDIDGLRALAVVAVVLYHVNPKWLPGGFAGVDVFFVISGYVVAGSLLHRSPCTLSEYVISFYARRVKRLMPTLLVVVTFSALLIAVIYPPEPGPGAVNMASQNYRSGMLAFIGMANNYFAFSGLNSMDEAEGNNYFDAHNRVDELRFGFLPEHCIFTHTWSLGVEEQFYIFFPIIMRMSCRVKVLTMIAVCSMALSCILTFRSPQLAFYIMPSRFWEMAVGALPALATDVLPRLHGVHSRLKLLRALLSALACSIIVAALVCTPEDPFPFPFALLAVSGTLCYVMVGPSSPAFFNCFLAHNIPIYLGKLSYSIYLWHQPVFFALKRTIGFSTAGQRICALIVTMLLACQTYHGLEKPFGKWRPKQNWKVFALMLPPFCGAMLWLCLLMGPLGGQFYSGGALPKREWGYILGVNASTCACDAHGGSLHWPRWSRNAVLDSSLPPCIGESNSAAAIDPDRLSNDRCAFGQPGDRQQEKCFELERDEGDGQLAVFLIGDSHAAHLVPTFLSITSGNAIYFRHVTLYNGLCNYSTTTSTSIRDSIVLQLQRSLRPRDVLVASYYHRNFNLQLSSMSDWLWQLQHITSSRQASLVLLGNHHDLPDGLPQWMCPPSWLDRASQGICNRPRSEVEMELLPMHDLMSSVAKQPGVFFFDYHHLFCDAVWCYPRIPGTRVTIFSDTNHFAVSGALSLWPFLCMQLQDAFERRSPTRA